MGRHRHLALARHAALPNLWMNSGSHGTPRTWQNTSCQLATPHHGFLHAPEPREIRQDPKKAKKSKAVVCLSYAHGGQGRRHRGRHQQQHQHQRRHVDAHGAGPRSFDGHGDKKEQKSRVPGAGAAFGCAAALGTLWTWDLPVDLPEVTWGGGQSTCSIRFKRKPGTKRGAVHVAFCDGRSQRGNVASRRRKYWKRSTSSICHSSHVPYSSRYAGSLFSAKRRSWGGSHNPAM